MKKKGVALISGGLDSTVALRMMLDQGFEMVALNFITPFCTCTSKSSGCSHQASKVAKELGIEAKVIYKGLDYVEMIRAPKYGYGRNMNPCVDCRIFMHKEARKFMDEIGASFIVTGEVLGQRPMSQRLDAFRIIERDSGLEGLVVRPLSAGLLPPTLPELSGAVDRNRLLDISGRSRRTQMDMAEGFGLKDYPCASGGCLLTDAEFAKRIRDLFKHSDSYTLTDVKLLRIGRHFRIDGSTKLILGRKEEENRELLALANGKEFHIFRPNNFSGPTAVIKGNVNGSAGEFAGSAIFKYSKLEDGFEGLIEHLCDGSIKKTISIRKGPEVDPDIRKI